MINEYTLSDHVEILMLLNDHAATFKIEREQYFVSKQSIFALAYSQPYSPYLLRETVFSK